MKLQKIRSYDLGIPIRQLRSANITLRDGQPGMLFVFSEEPNIDPGEEYVHFAQHPLHIAVYTEDGTRLWEKVLGLNVLPGVWFCPVLPFDLDQDGVDEVYFLNNNSDAPFSMEHRRLQRLDGMTGELTGDWPWPKNTEHEPLSHCYRYYLLGGYAHGEPVLIASQGTYGDMFLQGYGPGMKKRWDTVIAEEAPGPRTSHVTPVLDYNGDGVDEVFWGERVLSVADGHEIYCYAPKYHGHSDALVPFMDYRTKEMYLFTCREDHETEGERRVQVFRMDDGTVAWNAIDAGHMHRAWVATLLDGYRKQAMVMRVVWRPTENGYEHAYDGEFYFDAYTGAPMEWKLPVKGSMMTPIDLNGDGYHELLTVSGPEKGRLFDRNGTELARIDGTLLRSGKLVEHPGEQLMMYQPGEPAVWILADEDAADGEIIRMRYATGYHRFMQKLTATGYNGYGGAISAGI